MGSGLSPPTALTLWIGLPESPVLKGLGFSPPAPLTPWIGPPESPVMKPLPQKKAKISPKIEESDQEKLVELYRTGD